MPAGQTPLALQAFPHRQAFAVIGSTFHAARFADDGSLLDPTDKDMYFDPMEDKVYRHPTFYKLPESVDHM